MRILRWLLGEFVCAQTWCFHARVRPWAKCMNHLTRDQRELHERFYAKD